jgi:hypothetical protein
MPGFFALAAETPALRVAWNPRCGSRGHALPAPIGWGSGREARASGACCRPADGPGSLLDSRAWFARPETSCPRAGLVLADLGLHAPSTVSMSSIMGQTVLPDTITEGQAPAFRPPFARAPLLRRGRFDDLVQVSGLLLRSTPNPRWASRLASNPSSRCLELRFYNRRCTSRAPAETSSLETVRRRTVGKPASSSTCRIAPGLCGRAARAENDAGPPCGHPASSSRALDGALPASGRSTITRCQWHG